MSRYADRSGADVLALMHLQWFAAEDEGRTEEPTEHKIEKAREEGKVAKSQDVTSSVILLFSVVALLIFSRFILDTIVEMMHFYYGRLATVDITTDRTIGRAFFGYFTRLLLPVAAVATVAALAGSIAQVGFLFTTKPITPDLNRIAPKFGKFFQKALMSAEAGFNLAKSLGKVIIIAALGVINVATRIGEITNTINVAYGQAFLLIVEIAFNILLQAAIILLVLSIFDYFFQRRQHRESLKMTKQEIKEERKTYEGDPLIKSRMRQRMNELLSKNMMRNVPEADVVITNPTHFAVAMEYRRESMSAPTVVAKGQDHLALRIREVAHESGVPVVENRPLARALFSEVEIGDSIPEKFYEAVVIVLKQVYEMTGRVVGGR